jgi:urease accessory protein
MNAKPWAAKLSLNYESRGDKTVLARRQHTGPLIIQKPFYPEGSAVCHTIIVHPPGGIAAGDQLELEACLGEGAHALITTPGATRWYRSTGSVNASQRIVLTVAPGAVLEWLPQETIYFNGTIAESALEIQLCGDAVFIACEIACLGRLAAGERFTHGKIARCLTLARDGKLMLVEQSRLEAGSLLLNSPIGLAGEPVYGALLVSGKSIDDGILKRACALSSSWPFNCGVTRVDDILIARYLGSSIEEGKQLLHSIWAELRFHVTGRIAATPRIWQT